MIQETQATLGGALLSDCRRYRYVLWRRWAPDKRFGGARADRPEPLQQLDADLDSIFWVLLNPSTADASENDATIRRVINFSRAWGFGGAVVANLFALRSTDPAGLLGADDPVGPENDEQLAVLLATAAGEMVPIVCAWGAGGAHRRRDAEVLDLIRRTDALVEERVFCLGLTKAGHPLHPVRLPRDLGLVPFPLLLVSAA